MWFMKFSLNIVKNASNIIVEIVTVNQYNLMSVVTGLWTGRSGIQSPPITINTLLIPSVHTNCVAHPAVYPVGTVGFAHGVETA